jgi:hypothetical protein
MQPLILFAIWYIVMGLMMTILACYVSGSLVSPEEMMVTLFFWPLIIYIVWRDEGGWSGVIEKGFTDNKKAFFMRYLVVVLCLIILFSFVVFLDNILF